MGGAAEECGLVPEGFEVGHLEVGPSAVTIEIASRMPSNREDSDST